MALSFSVSVLLLLMSSSLFAQVEPVWAFLSVIVIIAVGIAFDMIGVAVAAAEETPFHSMASRKVRGARHSILLIRNAPKVSSICNDVVGDICSVVSGTAGAAIVFRLYGRISDTTWVEILMGAVIAALTVGGKAFGKNFGMENSNYIIFAVGRLFSFFSEARQRQKRRS
jgi:Mg2+/Co2+ transporter CorB